ncbi:hypothetical protein WA577_000537, partial [Blastocystis sp. JDR]
MSADSLLQKLPTVQQLLDFILNDDKDHFRDISLIVDTSLLQKAAAIIDNRQVKRVVTVPESVVSYEFTKSGRGEPIHYCLPHHCECNKYSLSLTSNSPVLLCEHLLAIAIIRQQKLEIPTKKVALSD